MFNLAAYRSQTHHIFNKSQTIAGCQSPYGSAAVYGVFNLAFRTNDEPSRMKMIFLKIKEGSGNCWYIGWDESVAYRKSQTVFVNCLARVLFGVRRSCNDLDVLFFKFGYASLEVQQLLAAIRSPATAIDKEYIPVSVKIFWKIDRSAANDRKVHLWKKISSIQYLAWVTTSHGWLLWLEIFR